MLGWYQILSQWGGKKPQHPCRSSRSEWFRLWRQKQQSTNRKRRQGADSNYWLFHFSTIVEQLLELNLRLRKLQCITWIQFSIGGQTCGLILPKMTDLRSFWGGSYIWTFCHAKPTCSAQPQIVCSSILVDSTEESRRPSYIIIGFVLTTIDALESLSIQQRWIALTNSKMDVRIYVVWPDVSPGCSLIPIVDYNNWYNVFVSWDFKEK